MDPALPLKPNIAPPAPATTAPTQDLAAIDFHTVAEVAAWMRVSKMTVYRMVHSGELSAVRVGRSFRIPAAAVRGYLSSAFVTGT